MAGIYEPSGAAREYSPLALNYIKGCDHGCLYCYVPKIMKRFDSMCGTYEICHAKKEGSKFIKWIDDLYANERMNGNKQTCKGFKKIN